MFKYYPTKNMLAGVLTKLLAKDRHQAWTKTMNLKTFDYLQSGRVLS